MQVATATEEGLTRRRLLASGGAAALALLLAGPLGRPAAVAAGGGGGPPRHLARSSYAGLVGEPFMVERDRRPPLAVRLVEIRDLAGRSGDEDAFALLFHGPRAPQLGQAVHRLRHATLGSFDLLLAPSGTGRRGQDYEAIINRVRSERA